MVTSLSSISRPKFWPKARTNKTSKLWYLLRPNDQLRQDRAPNIPAWFCGKVHLPEMQPYINEVDTFVQNHFLSRAISIVQICNLFEFCCGFHWSSVIFAFFFSMARSHQQESSWWFLTTHLKNMLVKMGSSSPNRVENKKHLSCHPRNSPKRPAFLATALCTLIAWQHLWDDATVIRTSLKGRNEGCLKIDSVHLGIFFRNYFDFARYWLQSSWKIS